MGAGHRSASAKGQPEHATSGAGLRTAGPRAGRSFPIGTTRLAQLALARTDTSPVCPAMRRILEWNGVVYVVTIGEDGVVQWHEREWRSLSDVARAITGTRWSRRQRALVQRSHFVSDDNQRVATDREILRIMVSIRTSLPRGPPGGWQR